MGRHIDPADSPVGLAAVPAAWALTPTPLGRILVSGGEAGAERDEALASLGYGSCSLNPSTSRPSNR
jgi:hypothetical protein